MTRSSSFAEHAARGQRNRGLYLVETSPREERLCYRGLVILRAWNSASSFQVFPPSFEDSPRQTNEFGVMSSKIQRVKESS